MQRCRSTPNRRRGAVSPVLREIMTKRAETSLPAFGDVPRQSEWVSE